MQVTGSRKDSGYISLRQRYLSVAMLVIVLLVMIAVTVTVYVTRATKQNTYTLQLRNSVAQSGHVDRLC